MDEQSLNLVVGSRPRRPLTEVIGRDEFVDLLINLLKAGSVQMAAPRRIGKSWVLSLLEVKGAVHAEVIYFDLEGVHQLPDFIDKLAKEGKARLSRFDFAFARVLEAFLKSRNVTGLPLEWKQHLEDVFETINKNERPVWLLFDEFPVFLNNLIVAKQEKLATEILDFLRSIRGKYQNIRFVLTGSIGLHWIIERLEKATGWRNPTNDINRIALEVLDEAHAIELSKKLLRGIGQSTDHAEELARALHCHPFYIQKTIGLLAIRKKEESITFFCERLAISPEDHFEFSELNKRLGDYFGNQSRNAKKILDKLAGDNPLTAKEISHSTSIDAEMVFEILNNLEMDGYTKIKEGKHHIWPPLFRKYWNYKSGGLYE